VRSYLFIFLTLILVVGCIPGIAYATQDGVSVEFRGSPAFSESMQDEVTEDLEEQVALFESILGVECPQDIKIVVYRQLNWHVAKGLDGKSIYAIADDKFMESTGKVTPIFPQLIISTWQSCPYGTLQILSNFLIFKYLGINPLKLSTEFRYTFTLNDLITDPDAKFDIKPLSDSLVMITCSRLYQVEHDHGKETFRQLLYSMKYGISDAVKRILGMDFVTFVRSLRYELPAENGFAFIKPSGDFKPLLNRSKQLKDVVWSNLPYIKSEDDVAIRFRPEYELQLAIIEMVIDKPKSTIIETLDRIDNYLYSRDRIFQTWWLFTGIAVIILVLLMSASLLSGLKYKDTLA